MSEKDYFEYSDGWVFITLFQYDSEWKKVDLTNMIAQGDMLNHAIFTLDELSNGFRKLQIKELIKINEDQIILSEEALRIKKSVLNSGVGLFSMVEYTLKLLNSKKVISENLDLNLISKCEFLTENNLSKAYQKYTNKST